MTRKKSLPRAGLHPLPIERLSPQHAIEANRRNIVGLKKNPYQLQRATTFIQSKIKVHETVIACTPPDGKKPDVATVIAHFAKGISLHSGKIRHFVHTMRKIWMESPQEATWQKSPNNYYLALSAVSPVTKMNLPASVEYVTRIASKNNEAITTRQMCEILGVSYGSKYRPLVSASIQLLVAGGYIEAGIPRSVKGKLEFRWQHTKHPVSSANFPNVAITVLQLLSIRPHTRKEIEKATAGKKVGKITKQGLQMNEKRLVEAGLITRTKKTFPSRSPLFGRVQIGYTLTPKAAEYMQSFAKTGTIPPELSVILQKLYPKGTRAAKKSF